MELAETATAACSGSSSSSSSSSLSDFDHDDSLRGKRTSKRRKVEGHLLQPGDGQKRRRSSGGQIAVRVLGLSGKVLWQLPRAQRRWPLIRIKEMIEAVLLVPKPTQRLVLLSVSATTPSELIDDFVLLDTLCIGSGRAAEDAGKSQTALGEVPLLEITLLRESPKPDALFCEASSGHSSACLALLRLPEGEGLLNFVSLKSGWSCLHVAAKMRLSATCLAILGCPRFEWINEVDRAVRTALHWAAVSGLAEVCRAIVARADFDMGHHLDSGGLTALHCAIGVGQEAASCALAKCLDIAALETRMRGWCYQARMDNPTPRELAAKLGYTEIVGAIDERLMEGKAAAAAQQQQPVSQQSPRVNPRPVMARALAIQCLQRQ